MEDVELEHAYFAVALKGRHPDGERPALQLWAEGYLRAAAPCLERIRALAAGHAVASAKMGGLQARPHKPHHRVCLRATPTAPGSIASSAR